jgi:2-polyprenyl-6-methoxyphenol hydroxylase-like FAD-dependent oxidoreductase
MGIAGPTLANWVLRFGFAPTIVERAPTLRTEGYMIDFWGAGYDVAVKMGLLDAVTNAGYRVREVRIVDQRGRRAGGFDAEVFRAATRGRFTSLPRGDLSAILAHSIEGHAEVLLGESIVELEQGDDGVLASFERAPARRFDLVIGADGLHSRVRELVFGPEAGFERYLGYTVAAFTIPGYRPRTEDVYFVYAEPGREIMQFAMRNDQTMFLIILVDEDRVEASPNDLAAQKAYLERRCAGMGWECRRILETMAGCDHLYVDRVSQIHMPCWSKHRVALVGDAAFAPSLLAGQGSALAMVGAYVLAGELSRHASPAVAFRRYEHQLRAFVDEKQTAAARLAHSFVPRTRLGIFLRNQITKALVLPSLAKLVLGPSLTDKIALPDFGLAAA